MKLVRWHENPWKSLELLHNELDRFFEQPLGKTIFEKGLFSAPSLDISEDKDSIYVEADVPGVEQKDINISLRKNFLCIQAKKEETKDRKEKNYHRLERVSRNFYREVFLPKTVDADKVKAVYKKGVLNLTLPKKEEEKEKEIKIDVE
jgi:HSP20 family protein